MDLIVLIFSFLCVLGLIDKIIQRWGLAQYVDAAVFAMSSTILPYIGICCVGAVLVGKLTQVLSVSESYLPAIIIGSLLSPDLGGFKLCQEIVREQEWFFFCSLILAGCIGQFISFQLPIFSSTIHDSQDILIQGFIAGIIAAPAGILTGGVVIGIPLLSILCNCLPVWAICILIAVGFLKRPALTQRVLKMFGEVLQSLCIGLFAAGGYPAADKSRQYFGPFGRQHGDLYQNAGHSDWGNNPLCADTKMPEGKLYNESVSFGPGLIQRDLAQQHQQCCYVTPLAADEPARQAY